MERGDRIADWVALVDASYPERDAEGWDQVGLQVGDPADPVTGVLVCLDVTDATLDEARDRGAELLLAHHPLLFRPLGRLTPATASGRLALRAARDGTGVLAAHTNLDVAVPGTTDPIAAALGLVDVRPLVPRPPDADPGVKLVTFVPVGDTARVLAAMSAAGAGRVGDYDEVSFRTTGTGSFRPGPGAHPTIGARGVGTDVVEDRLEVLVPTPFLGGVVAALRDAHPYEEVAWDAFPRLPDPVAAVAAVAAGRGRGLGLVGRLPAPLPLSAVADALAGGLPSPHLRVAGDLDRVVRTVAACGGAGDSLIDEAVASGADVYVTGDLRHHVALDAGAQGLALVDAGHWATEAPALAAFRTALGAAAGVRGLRARLLASDVRTEPWADYRPPAGVGDGAGTTRTGGAG